MTERPEDREKERLDELETEFEGEAEAREIAFFEDLEFREGLSAEEGEDDEG